MPRELFFFLSLTITVNILNRFHCHKHTLALHHWQWQWANESIPDKQFKYHLIFGLKTLKPIDNVILNCPSNKSKDAGCRFFLLSLFFCPVFSYSIHFIWLSRVSVIRFWHNTENIKTFRMPVIAFPAHTHTQKEKTKIFLQDKTRNTFILYHFIKWK